MKRLANGMLAATRGRSRVQKSRVLPDFCVAVFLHFVSFQISAADILLLSLRKIFPTGHPKRNAR